MYLPASTLCYGDNLTSDRTLWYTNCKYVAVPLPPSIHTAHTKSPNREWPCSRSCAYSDNNGFEQMLVCFSLSVPVQMHACASVCARAPKVRLEQMQTYSGSLLSLLSDNFQWITRQHCGIHWRQFVHILLENHSGLVLWLIVLQRVQGSVGANVIGGYFIIIFHKRY